MKKVIFFDLDKTLAESKSAIKPSMSNALEQLLHHFSVAVISGGNFTQFNTQLLGNLEFSDPENLNNLHLLPVSGTEYYSYKDGNWNQIYQERLSESQKDKIIGRLEKMITQHSLDKLEQFGERIEDRGSQITYSAFGQKAPGSVKENWDPTKEKRLSLIDEIKDELSEFELRVGGSTSIDVTLKGMTKAYGIKKLMEILKVELEEIMYVGDDVKPGGNDYAAVEMGAETIGTSGPEETLNIIKDIIKKYGK